MVSADFRRLPCRLKQQEAGAFDRPTPRQSTERASEWSNAERSLLSSVSRESRSRGLSRVHNGSALRQYARPHLRLSAASQARDFRTARRPPRRLRASADRHAPPRGAETALQNVKRGPSPAPGGSRPTTLPGAFSIANCQGTHQSRPIRRRFPFNPHDFASPHFAHFLHFLDTKLAGRAQRHTAGGIAYWRFSDP